ncbi:hypothetical protein ABDK00_014325 [Niabella insulamsoli]|uniref:hypothetical protein n=1 Tax=Niabella insulamsoli TaxID=3144874 RepID=UPI0031FC238E
MVLLKPLHNLLLAFSVLFFAAAFFTLKKTLDIHLPAQMIVISFAHIFMFTAVYFAALWLAYTFTIKWAWSERLYKIHILATVVLVSFLLATALWSNPILEKWLQNDPLQKQLVSLKIGQLITGGLLILTTIQLVYPLNLVIGLIKNRKN